MAHWNKAELNILRSHLRHTELDITIRLQQASAELGRSFQSVRGQYYHLRQVYKTQEGFYAPRYTKYSIV